MTDGNLRSAGDGELLDRADQIQHLGKRVDRLLQEDVSGRREHPVTELACHHLAQRYVVLHVNMFYRPYPRQCPLQLKERRMVNEILVHAEAAATLDGRKCLCIRTAGGQRLLQQNVNACSEQRLGDRPM